MEGESLFNDATTVVLFMLLLSAATTTGPQIEPLNAGMAFLRLALGGLRGAVTLALSLPLELEGWWTVQSVACGVVLFSLFIQAPAIEPLLNRLQGKGRL